MSFAAESRQRGAPVLPLAAMVDMLFLLLIFFLYQSAQREQQLEVPVDLPPAQSAQSPSAAPPLFITIDEQNRIFLGSRQYTLDSLPGALQALASTSTGEGLVIRGDSVADLGVAVRVLDMARAAGIKNARLAAAKKP